jgi:hypothetical protein
MSLLHLTHGLLNSPYIIGKIVYKYGFSWFAPTVSIVKSQEIELQTPEDKRLSKNKCTALIPYIPIQITMPTAYDVSVKIISTTVVEIPLYIIKSLYNSPIPTAVALYAVLPADVWMIVGPRILYYLPRLLVL